MQILIMVALLIVASCVFTTVGDIIHNHYATDNSWADKCHCGWDADGRIWKFCGRCGGRKGEHMQIKSHC